MISSVKLEELIARLEAHKGRRQLSMAIVDLEDLVGELLDLRQLRSEFYQLLCNRKKRQPLRTQLEASRDKERESRNRAAYDGASQPPHPTRRRGRG